MNINLKNFWNLKNFNILKTIQNSKNSDKIDKKITKIIVKMLDIIFVIRFNSKYASISIDFYSFCKGSIHALLMASFRLFTNL